jgi:hypothetical protein
MAAGTSPIFPAAVETAAQDYVNADSTSYQDVLTAGVNGALVYTLQIATDDTAAIEWKVAIQRDGTGTDWLLGTVNVPIGSGNSNAAPAVDLLDPSKIKGLDGDGNLILGGGDKLRVAPKTAVTAAKTAYVTASYGDF